MAAVTSAAVADFIDLFISLWPGGSPPFPSSSFTPPPPPPRRFFSLFLFHFRFRSITMTILCPLLGRNETPTKAEG